MRSATTVFRDRADAGTQLAGGLAAYRREAPVVVALPRGGVVVGYYVARGLQAPLDVLVVRKLGAPDYPELAIGAIARDRVVLNDAIIRSLGVTEAEIRAVAERERVELARRETMYRMGRLPLTVEGRTVILADDGIATGATVAAAIAALRLQRPARIVVAVPVCSRPAAAELRTVADEVVALHTPADFDAVGQWYEDFGQTTDEEVVELLRRATEPIGAAPPRSP